MYKGLIIIVTLLLFDSRQITESIDYTGYIEIKHTGIEQYLIKPLFIGMKNVTIEVRGDYAIINNKKYGPLNSRDKMILSNSLYSTLSINKKTFQKISLFIHQYHFFLSKSAEKKLINYSIVSGGQINDISYKKTRSFFSQLIKFLKIEGCDQNDINRLDTYLDQNLMAPN